MLNANNLNRITKTESTSKSCNLIQSLGFLGFNPVTSNYQFGSGIWSAQSDSSVDWMNNMDTFEMMCSVELPTEVFLEYQDKLKEVFKIGPIDNGVKQGLHNMEKKDQEEWKNLINEIHKRENTISKTLSNLIYLDNNDKKEDLSNIKKTGFDMILIYMVWCTMMRCMALYKVDAQRPQQYAKDKMLQLKGMIEILIQYSSPDAVAYTDLFAKFFSSKFFFPQAEAHQLNLDNHAAGHNNKDLLKNLLESYLDPAKENCKLFTVTSQEFDDDDELPNHISSLETDLAKIERNKMDKQNRYIEMGIKHPVIIDHANMTSTLPVKMMTKDLETLY